MATDILDAALTELGQEHSVIPICWTDDDENCQFHDECKSPGKVPLIIWAEFQTRLATPDEVREWCKKWPDRTSCRGC